MPTLRRFVLGRVALLRGTNCRSQLALARVLRIGTERSWPLCDVNGEVRVLSGWAGGWVGGYVHSVLNVVDTLC